MSFTAEVREEVAHVSRGRECCQRVETGVLLRLAGSFLRTGGTSGWGYGLTSSSAAVVRRARATVQALGADCELHVVQPGTLQRRLAYRLRLEPPADAALSALGLLSQEGTPVQGLLAQEPARHCDRAAGVRGALLASASIATPGQDPHLELRAPGQRCAEDLAVLLRACGAEGVRAGPHRDEWRVVVKSGESIGVLLAHAGAHAAFLRWDQERMHRELRRAATRSANADRANLSRTAVAAADQVAALEQALADVEWQELDQDLQEVVLARLANPEASLSELGRLLEPAVSKSTVHRRIARVIGLSGDADSGG